MMTQIGGATLRAAPGPVACRTRVSKAGTDTRDDFRQVERAQARIAIRDPEEECSAARP